MLEWIHNNQPVLSLATNFGMLVIWVVYLGIFLRQYRRQTQPKIVINRAAGNSLDAICFVSNMSTEPIYVEAIIVSLETEEASWSSTVTDIVLGEGEEIPSDPRHMTRQGPMRSGDYMPVGSFSDLLERIVQDNDDIGSISIEDLKAPVLRLRIVADYASEDLVIGAERTFNFEREGNGWNPRSGMPTVQMRSRRQRRLAQQHLTE